MKETEARHGIALFGVNGLGVMVYDNTGEGLNWTQGRIIAEEAANNPIYWNDCDCFYWMYDFRACGHWCEMVNAEDESPYECLHINVYD